MNAEVKAYYGRRNDKDFAMTTNQRMSYNIIDTAYTYNIMCPYS